MRTATAQGAAADVERAMSACMCCPARPLHQSDISRQCSNVSYQQKKPRRQKDESAQCQHRAIRTRKSNVLCFICVLLLLFTCLSAHRVRADDEILAELLREEAEANDDYHDNDHRAEVDTRKPSPGDDKYDNPPPNMNAGMGGKKKMPRGGAAGGNGGFDSVEDELRRKEETAAKARAKAEEEAAAKVAEQHRLQREADFEAEVARMDAEHRRKALKQKKHDARIVNKILRAASAKPEPRHYAVLGIRNWDIYIWKWHIMKTTTKDVKRAYRNLSRKVHPDKNRDGRAEEAFHALEASAAILSDVEKKRSYDRRVAARRKKRNTKITGGTLEVFGIGLRNVGRIVGVVKSVLGPFSTPIFVLGALII